MRSHILTGTTGSATGTDVVGTVANRPMTDRECAVGDPAPWNRKGTCEAHRRTKDAKHGNTFGDFILVTHKLFSRPGNFNVTEDIVSFQRNTILHADQSMCRLSFSTTAHTTAPLNANLLLDRSKGAKL